VRVLGRAARVAITARRPVAGDGLLDSVPPRPYPAPPDFRRKPRVMRIRNSLRAAKVRDKNCRVVRRRGRVYVINKKNPRMKCRQG